MRRDEDPYGTGERQDRERVGQEWPQNKAKPLATELRLVIVSDWVCVWGADH